ncbi:hypothetical protein D3C87_631880 [compost metagenome]
MPYISILTYIFFIHPFKITSITTGSRSNFPLLKTGQPAISPSAISQYVFKRYTSDRMIHFVYYTTTAYPIWETPISGAVLQPPKFRKPWLKYHRIMISFCQSLIASRLYKFFKFGIGQFVLGNPKRLYMYCSFRIVQTHRIPQLIISLRNQNISLLLPY